MCIYTTAHIRDKMDQMPGEILAEIIEFLYKPGYVVNIALANKLLYNMFNTASVPLHTNLVVTPKIPILWPGARYAICYADQLHQRLNDPGLNYVPIDKLEYYVSSLADFQCIPRSVSVLIIQNHIRDEINDDHTKRDQYSITPGKIGTYVLHKNVQRLHTGTYKSIPIAVTHNIQELCKPAGGLVSLCGSKVEWLACNASSLVRVTPTLITNMLLMPDLDLDLEASTGTSFRDPYSVLADRMRNKARGKAVIKCEYLWVTNVNNIPVDNIAGNDIGYNQVVVTPIILRYKVDFCGRPVHVHDRESLSVSPPEGFHATEWFKELFLDFANETHKHYTIDTINRIGNEHVRLTFAAAAGERPRGRINLKNTKGVWYFWTPCPRDRITISTNTKLWVKSHLLYHQEIAYNKLKYYALIRESVLKNNDGLPFVIKHPRGYASFHVHVRIFPDTLPWAYSHDLTGDIPITSEEYAREYPTPMLTTGSVSYSLVSDPTAGDTAGRRNRGYYSDDDGNNGNGGNDGDDSDDDNDDGGDNNQGYDFNTNMDSRSGQEVDFNESRYMYEHIGDNTESDITVTNLSYEDVIFDSIYTMDENNSLYDDN